MDSVNVKIFVKLFHQLPKSYVILSYMGTDLQKHAGQC